MTDEGGPNTCIRNPGRRYADHCYHDSDDGRDTVCRWCGFSVRLHRPDARAERLREIRERLLSIGFLMNPDIAYLLGEVERQGSELADARGSIAAAAALIDEVVAYAHEQFEDRLKRCRRALGAKEDDRG
jgi:hypothetical protein